MEAAPKELVSWRSCLRILADDRRKLKLKGGVLKGKLGTELVSYSRGRLGTELVSPISESYSRGLSRAR